MPHLMLTRREGQRLFLHLDPSADPAKILNQLMTQGITLQVSEVFEGKVKLSIEAPADIKIFRTELLEREPELFPG